MAATVECQKVNAELVMVNDKNYDYLAQTISSSSGNDNWIGTGQIGGKQYKRQGTKCPIIRGSGSAMGSKISTLDCSVAAPFVCGYNPNPMPQYPAYGPPRGGPMGPGMGYGPGGGFPPPPQYGAPNYPNYGAPPGAAGPGGIAPPQYDQPEIPDYDVVTSATDVSTDLMATEEADGGGSPVVYILIIALIVCAGFAYKYWKNNYASPPPEVPKSAPPKTDTTPLSTTGGDGKNVMGWKPPGDQDQPTLPPKSFDNPVFRENHQAQEEIEADEFRPDELPPGMTMEDPRNPNQNRKSSRRGTNRYNDEPFGDQRNQSSRSNKQDKYKEFEIPEGMPQWDPSAPGPTEMDSFEMGRHRVFDQMRSPAAGGPPNSMSMSRDYRQMYNDNPGRRDERDKDCDEIELELERVESFQTEITEKTVSKQESNFDFFSEDEESIYSQDYGKVEGSYAW